jgi:type IV secretory pathway TraG/TraD family ATPase VirD4
MANDKQSNNETGPIITVVVLGMVLIAIIKLIIAVVFMAILTIGIALSLAYKEKILRWKGESWKAISWSKLKFALMLIPLTLTCAVLAEYYIPTKIKFNSLTLSEPKILTKEELISKIENQIKKLRNDSLKKTNEVQEGIVEFQQLERKVDETSDSYEKDKAREELEEKRSNLLQKNGQVKKNLSSLPKLQKQLINLKNELSEEPEAPKDSATELINNAIGFLTERNKTGRVSDFINFGLIFLAGAFLSSFVLTSLIKEEDLEKRVGISNVSRVSYYFFTAMSWMSFPFIWPLLIGQYFWNKGRKKEENRKIDNSRMQLGHQSKAYLTDRNLNYHTQIIGGSGAGKTNLLKVMLEDRIAKGHAIIFFDFKGEVDLVDWMAGATEYYGRRNDMVMISMADPKTSYAYNPISLGTETEISSQIMNAFTWSESFYKNSAENALLIILKAFCYKRDMTGKTFHLGDLYQFLTDPSFRMDMVSAVSQLNYPEMFKADLKRICEELSTNKKENYLSLVTQISKILNSSAGEIVAHKIGHDKEFNLKEAMSSGKITYFMMNNLKLKETAAIMGKLILQDLMKTVGNIYDDRNYQRNPVTLIIDEFASFATPDFGEFIEKARGAGISIVVTYQSRKSLDHIEQSLSLKMNENTANKIVFQVQDSEDVEWFCSLLGTKTTTKETYQTENGFFGDTKTGAKSMREVEEYVIHPNEIKKLKLGQALLYCSKVDPHYVLMSIKRANEFEGRYERNGAPVEKSVMPESVNVWPVAPQNNNGVEFDNLV